MRAIILAGGHGTRLRPYTTVIPKPLLPVGDTPILEIVIRQLAHHGFDRITLSLGYMAEYFRLFVDHRESLRRLVRIEAVEEERPTGTAGSLSAIPDLESPFLVMNGDLLTDLDYGQLIAFHKQSGSVLTIAAQNKTVDIDLGVIDADEEGRVTAYTEKPRLPYLISMGVYVYQTDVLRHIPKGGYLDFPDLVLKLLAGGEKVSIFRNDALWLDLGRVEDLRQATDVFLAHRQRFLPSIDRS
jgi:NDP-mannose synthase